MQSLFDDGLLVYFAEFLPDSDLLFDQLVAEIAWDDRFKARRVASFGVPYNYSGTEWPQVDIPAPLAEVAQRVAAVMEYEPNNCLVNYYPDGDSRMGYHSDSVLELEPGTGISIVSLGADRSLSLRSELDRSVIHELPLTGGSLLHMSAAMQASWRHAIRRSPDVTGGRISLSFRRFLQTQEDITNEDIY